MLIIRIIINLIKLIISKIYHAAKNKLLHNPAFTKKRKIKIAIVGGGISGITTAIKLKKSGYKNFTIFEKCLKVGGVWHTNRYPGCASESPSKIYQMYSERKIWKQKYCTAEQIQKYIEELCTKYELFKKMVIGVTVQSADWDDKTNSWLLYYDGKFERFDVLISGTGRMQKPLIPDFPGINDFQGIQMHTANWGYTNPDFVGKRVGIIGTGASGSQLIPGLYKKFGRNFDLFIFQRSAAYCLEKKDKYYSSIKIGIYNKFPVLYRISQVIVAVRQELLMVVVAITALFRKKPGGSDSIVVNMLKNRNYKILHKTDQNIDHGRFESYKIDHLPCCKRPVISDDYLQTLTRKNVKIMSSQISKINKKGLELETGETIDLDVIIFATGFDILSHMRNAIDITGTDCRKLAREWSENRQDFDLNSTIKTTSCSPRAFLGISYPNFPNFFRILGPNTGNTNSWFMAECCSDYVVRTLDIMVSKGAKSVDVKAEVEEEWFQKIRYVFSCLAFGQLCDDWEQNAIVWTLFPMPSVVFWLYCSAVGEGDFNFRK